MSKNIKLLGMALFLTFALSSLTSAQETFTITTYYPSPYGSYRELRAQRMAIGDTYYSGNTVCWGAPCPPSADNPDADTDLVVEGKVSIGTAVYPGLPSLPPTLYVLGPVEADGFRAYETSGAYAFLESGVNKTDNIVQLGGYTVAGAGGFIPTQVDGLPLLLQTRSTGNVGIGTTTPQGRLDIAAGTAAGYGNRDTSIIFHRTDYPTSYANRITNSFAGNPVDTTMNFELTNPAGNGYTNVMMLRGDGNVGIGTTNPGARLEVAGQVKITGGSPAANRVLTSDATGLASWQPGVPTGLYGICRQSTSPFFPNFNCISARPPAFCTPSGGGSICACPAPDYTREMTGQDTDSGFIPGSVDWYACYKN